MKYIIVKGPNFNDPLTWFERFSALYSVYAINSKGLRLRIGEFVSMKKAKEYIRKEQANEIKKEDRK